MFYTNLMVITKQKLIADTQKNKRESMHTTTKNHQFKRQTAREEERNRKTTKQLDNSK